MSWEVNQHINFYTIDYQQKELPAVIKYGAIALVLFVIYILVMAIWLYSEQRRLNAELNQLNTNMVTAQADIDHYNQIISQQKVDLILKKQLEKNKFKIKQQESLLHHIRMNTSNKPHDLLDNINDLASIKVDKIWLNGIHFQEKSMLLEGNIADADKITEYVNLLKKQASLKQLQSSVISIEKHSEKPWHIFSIEARVK